MRIFLGLLLSLFIVQHGHSQLLTGIIKDATDQPLAGVTVYFLNTSNGTNTDQNGAFVLIRKNNETQLVIAYTGFRSDTLSIPKDQNFLKLQLNEGTSLNEVVIQSKRESTSFSLLNPLNVESISSEEFKKAACCSLAESFQTGNTIDISYSNAVSGSKEIVFLGLRGLYSQLLFENYRFFNGIMTSQGFDYIPGTWLDNINILKGASTSIYGAQSMTGAINVGLKKPDKDHRVFTNLFADYHGRLEFNQHFNKSWTARKHSGVYLHLSSHRGNRDHNNDGFQDDARTKKIAVMQRNTIYGRRFEGQINVYGLHEEKNGGQITVPALYKFNQKNTHLQLFGNLGYIGFSNPDKNSGSIWEASISKIDAFFGESKNKFAANEFRFNSQLFYSEIFSEGKHKITFGPNLTINIAKEKASEFISDTIAYKEITPSIFFDYDLALGSIENTELKKFMLTISQRVDYINSSKLLYIPRVSARYNLNPKWTLRSSIGYGYRLPRVYSDNMNLFFINYKRTKLNIPSYESSLNYGLNIVGKPILANKELDINLDAYHTIFQNQLVTDVEDQDHNNYIVKYYNVIGNSSTTSLGLTMSYPVFSSINLKIGGKYIDSKTGFIHGQKKTPLIPTWRAMSTLDFNSKNKKWTANLTGQYVGKMRLNNKPNNLPLNEKRYSEDYYLIQCALNYILENWEFYAGCENLTNYTQHHAIYSVNEPLSERFNATEVYAPINGIKPYIGLRYKFK